MHITCSICAELFANADIDNISITPCGHIFHGPCLMQWIERSKTCPQCRRKTIFASVIRAYFTIPQTTDDATSGEGTVEQQNQIDNLRFELMEKRNDLKKKDEEIAVVTKKTADLKKTLKLSRETVIGLEQKVEQNKILSEAYYNQIKNFQLRVKEMERMEKERDEAKHQLQLMENIKQILMGSQKQAEEFLNENMSSKTLAVTAIALKRELESSETKRNDLRGTNRQLNAQIQRLLSEKNKIKEENAVLESRLYQFESAEKENKKQKSVASTSNGTTSESNRSIEIISPKQQSRDEPKDTISPPAAENRATKIIKYAKTEATSPYVKSSSIAGLAPLVKRTGGLSAKLKSSSGAMHSHEFSIFKKPRLANQKLTSLK